MDTPLELIHPTGQGLRSPKTVATDFMLQVRLP
jgi:hypothetical protein